MANGQVDEVTKVKAQREDTLAMLKLREIRGNLEAQARKADAERQMARVSATASIRDAQRRADEKDAKEKQAAKKKSQSTDEPVTKNLPTNSVANVKGSSQQGSTQDLTTMLPPTGEAPPFLMDHSRQTSLGMEALDPVVSAPVRRTTDQTRVSPNVLGQGERIRALQENWRLQKAEESAQLERKQTTITTEAEDLGNTVFSESQGEIEKGSIEARMGELITRYGRETATKILMGAKAAARGLELDRRKSEFTSEQIEGRTRRGEGRRATRTEATKEEKKKLPANVAKQKESEIQLRILDGINPTEAELAFLAERQKMDPIERLYRRVISNTNAMGKRATQADADRISKSTGITDTNELRSHMEAIGYVFE